MKTRLALGVSVVVFSICLAWVIAPKSTPTNASIRLRSVPFPMSVGPSTLLITLLGTDGTPVDGADVQVSAQMDHPGTLQIERHSNVLSNGEYSVPIIWSMMGQWTVEITADLPDGRGSVRERFPVYVYALPPFSTGNQTSYRSMSDLAATVSSNAARELWIVIPQGTQDMIKMGQGEEIIPAEIRLQVNGQNTLVIRNDDIADHTIGPFFVRSGETVRQQFTQPAIFEGTCSVRHSSEISIIVES